MTSLTSSGVVCFSLRIFRLVRLRLQSWFDLNFLIEHLECALHFQAVCKRLGLILGRVHKVPLFVDLGLWFPLTSQDISDFPVTWLLWVKLLEMDPPSLKCSARRKSWFYIPVIFWVTERSGTLLHYSLYSFFESSDGVLDVFLLTSIITELWSEKPSCML